MAPIESNEGAGRALTLTAAEWRLIVEALDSHMYWQLSDDAYRSNGDVLEPGSDDPERSEAIRAAELLRQRIDAEAGGDAS